MKLALLLVIMVIASCSAQQQTERSLPQCLSLCSNQFASCTEEYPGDASACLPARRDCETTCEAEKAMNRESRTRQSVEVEPIMLMRGDAGSDPPDSGRQAPD